MRAATEAAEHMSFDIIRYAQVWEDAHRLRRALQVGPEDSVLSITSAGCNALALLLDKPALLIATDLNPTQNAILELKKQAILHLNQKETAELLGYQASKERRKIFDSIAPKLAAPYQEYWLKHWPLIEKGLIHEGKLESYFRQFAEEYFAKIPDIQALKQAFFQTNWELQKTFQARFQEASFKKCFQWYFGRGMLEKGRDPAQFRYVSEDDIGLELHQRFMHSLLHTSLEGNHYLYYFIFGEPMPLPFGPDFILQDNFQQLKGSLANLQIRCESLEQVTRSVKGQLFSKVNLSNIFEYMSEDNMVAILQDLAPFLHSKARVAFWNLFVDRALPEALKSSYRLFPETKAEDRIFFYRAFHVLEKINS